MHLQRALAEHCPHQRFGLESRDGWRGNGFPDSGWQHLRISRAYRDGIHREMDRIFVSCVLFGGVPVIRRSLDLLHHDAQATQFRTKYMNSHAPKSWSLKMLAPLEPGIVCLDLDRMLQFYTEVVGLKFATDAEASAEMSAAFGTGPHGFRIIRLQTPYGERI